MSTLTTGRIRHTVSFTLVHEPGSEQERDFLAAQAALGAIPGVEAYELLREVSPKNGFRFGCSMEFAVYQPPQAAHGPPSPPRPVAGRGEGLP